MNQLDYALCTDCGEAQQANAAREASKEHDRQEALTAKKKAIADKRRATYWKPENVAKRKNAKAERKRVQAEQTRQRMIDAIKIVGSWLR